MSAWWETGPHSLLLLPHVHYPSSGAAPNTSSQTCSHAPKPRPCSFPMVSPHTLSRRLPCHFTSLSMSPHKVAASHREHLSPDGSAAWEHWGTYWSHLEERWKPKKKAADVPGHRQSQPHG